MVGVVDRVSLQSELLFSRSWTSSSFFAERSFSPRKRLQSRTWPSLVAERGRYLHFRDFCIDEKLQEVLPTQGPQSPCVGRDSCSKEPGSCIVRAFTRVVRQGADPQNRLPASPGIGKESRRTSRTSFGVKHLRGWGSVTLNFIPDFVVKTQNQSVPDIRFKSFTIPFLEDISR